MSTDLPADENEEPRVYRVASIGYFRKECYVLACSEEEADDLACEVENWKLVYQEPDCTEVELLSPLAEMAIALDG